MSFCFVVCFFYPDTTHRDEQKWIPAALSCSFNCIFSSFKWLSVYYVSTAIILQLLAHFEGFTKWFANNKWLKKKSKKKNNKQVSGSAGHHVAPSQVINSQVQTTLETENVSFTVHQFVCMPNCLCLFVVFGVTWATFAALTWLENYCCAHAVLLSFVAPPQFYATLCLPLCNFSVLSLKNVIFYYSVRHQCCIQKQKNK